MQLDLSGRHALVCGASQGIGRASAMELAELGASVTLLSRSADALKTATDALPRKHGQHHRWFAADMADTDSLREALADSVATHPIEILINNAGGPPGGPAHTATAEKCGINHGEATPKTTHNSASNTLLSVISRGAG